MKNKIITLIIPLLLLSASCNLFRKPVFAGVVKTVNGGADWQFSVALKDSKSGSLSGLSVSKLAFDPQIREIVFAGGYNGGLYKSEDSGASWKSISPNTNITIYDFAFNPYDSKIIYAAGIYNGSGKLIKTTDGAASWEEVYNEASSNNPVRAVAINPDNPNQLVIGLASGSLIQSADSGLSWKLAQNFNDRINRIIWQNGQVYVTLKTKGLYKSDSAMENFQNLTETLKNNSSVLSSSGNSVEWFNQAFVDPFSNNLIYLTTDKGLFKSTDGGLTWNKLALPTKQRASEAHGIAIAKTSSNIVFTSVAATIYKSTDAGQTWQTQSIDTTGYINYILIDPQLPQIAYGGIYV